MLENNFLFYLKDLKIIILKNKNNFISNKLLYLKCIYINI